ncbi:MAG: transcriptional repressor [Brasilonema octagenarum HA4186-MV1]|jgi:Fur family ferric uptake transcriptional regulator|uniref:Transcriptional repressor n=1 Tax=Brasilonema sennae CENA114 TaxID=415709 RepID=A0A856ML05_9CYAN|nr:Fur family transcriptional regulator [Brasilonema sennae]MBW4629811.1 transcriptional repressor [Brasilonema octagenarum HA4186-MV1]QDL11049.1 transcriptional repressor [Brasilonema sennae CENA114]QDL17393.1 transcriptional repressor [Brasilonema octagenarum UFV-E1]
MYTSDTLKAELKAKGYRFTPQRQVIFKIFQHVVKGDHLSAEKVHQLLVERGEGMSLSTVYRTLKIMARMGILRELELAQAQKYYELNTTSNFHHHHIVCVQCHQGLEFGNQAIIKQATKQVKKAGLELIDCQLTLHAICPEAIQKGWPASVPTHWICSRVTKTNNEFENTA